MLVSFDHDDPIVIDLGTGLRNLVIPPDVVGPHNVNVLLSHLHWDHIQGLGFCAPFMTGDTTVNIHGPAQLDGRSLEHMLSTFMQPPFFPLRPEELGSEVAIHDIAEETIQLGGVRVTSRWLHHPGPTLGFRIEADGMSLAFVSDHGPAYEGEQLQIPLGLLELCDGADVLIHDAQHTWEEYQTRQSWGHSPIEYAVQVAAASGARKLGFYHYDPNHTDTMIDAHVAHGKELATQAGLLEAFPTYEGLSLELSKELMCP